MVRLVSDMRKGKPEVVGEFAVELLAEVVHEFEMEMFTEEMRDFLFDFIEIRVIGDASDW